MVKISKRKRNKFYLIFTIVFIVLLFSLCLLKILKNNSLVFPRSNTITPSFSFVTPSPTSENTQPSVTYRNTQYGVQMTFPRISSYVKNEYPWPSHVKAYNSLISVSFASSKDKWFFSGNYYLDYDHPALIGDLPEFNVYDKNLCFDSDTDESEKFFCNSYVLGKDTSGVAKSGTVPQGYWSRNDKYVIFFEKGLTDSAILQSLYKIEVF